MSNLSMDNVASISHDMYVHRTMFTKPVVSHNHTHSVSKNKGANQSIPSVWEFVLAFKPILRNLTSLQ
jgi:hypothetical protein